MSELIEIQRQGVSRFDVGAYICAYLESVAGQKEYLHPDKTASKKVSVSITVDSYSNITEQYYALHQYIDILGHALKGIYDSYEDEYCFGFPEMIHNADTNMLTLCVYMLEKDRCEIKEK